MHKCTHIDDVVVALCNNIYSPPCDDNNTHNNTQSIWYISHHCMGGMKASDPTAAAHPDLSRLLSRGDLSQLYMYNTPQSPCLASKPISRTSKSSSSKSQQQQQQQQRAQVKRHYLYIQRGLHQHSYTKSGGVGQAVASCTNRRQSRHLRLLVRSDDDCYKQYTMKVT